MKTSMLTERIQLWRRELQETPEGDLSERWSIAGIAWAEVRLKGAEKGRLILDVRLRPTPHKFHRIKWQKVWADCSSPILENRNVWRVFAKSCPDLTGY
ncbi:hypothetical protein [Candidatus Odyssella thessalonicensis]|uniref:hypothetical protein n=1 Tax=Candidatus Odyssella thessalonicensis TaxID=84647 RepID=UPI000225C134|nr:hypothetical protein [Candidatus Odyssella thessalonicensis]